MQMKCILMMGTFDSKGKEFEYLYRELLRREVKILTMDTGIFEPEVQFEISVTSDEVAGAAGERICHLREKQDRGYAMRIMCQGAKSICRQLYRENKINGVISMGGGGGTSIAASAMQALPI